MIEHVFFDICIEGRKYNFGEQRGEGSGLLVGAAFENKPSSLTDIKIIKLQRAYDGCLGANRR